MLLRIGHLGLGARIRRVFGFNTKPILTNTNSTISISPPAHHAPAPTLSNLDSTITVTPNH